LRNALVIRRTEFSSIEFRLGLRKALVFYFLNVASKLQFYTIFKHRIRTYNHMSVTRGGSSGPASPNRML